MPPDRLKRVLVVDDRLEMAEMVADELTHRGYAALPLNSGGAAIDLLAREIFDAVITDLRMPQVDGLGVLRASRELDPSRPVIVMTGFGGIDSALEADREGAFHYITKPFELRKLVDLLQRALAGEAPMDSADRSDTWPVRH